MGTNILNYVRIKGSHCRLNLIMEILISIIEIHTSVCIYAIPEAWDMRTGNGVYGGHEESRAVTRSHDAGHRFKATGQGGGLVCFLISIAWPKHTSQPSSCSVFWHSGGIQNIHSFLSFFSIYFPYFVIIVGHHYGDTKLQSRLALVLDLPFYWYTSHAALTYI